MYSIDSMYIKILTTMSHINFLIKEKHTLCFFRYVNLL